MAFRFRYLPIILCILTSLTVLRLTAENGFASPADQARIAILISNNDDRYIETLAGIDNFFQGQKNSVDVIPFQLEGDRAKTASALSKIERQKVNLIIALGSLALDSATEKFRNIPIIAGMVLRDDKYRELDNVTGVFLEFSYETQLAWIKRALPQTNTVGVLYNTKENKERIAAATKVANTLGLSLEAFPVNKPKELPKALDRLSNRVDVLWGISDTIVLTPQTAKHILLFSLRYRIPFVGLSSAWVKAGALYALDWDFADIGKQCGEMAMQLLNGDKIDDVPAVSPRKALFILNRKTAERMKIDIPQKIIQEASHVY